MAAATVSHFTARRLALLLSAAMATATSDHCMTMSMLSLALPLAAATSDHFMTMSMGCGAISECASSRAYVDAFSKMHQGMALNFTCNANVDFVHGMIAHHEGEVAMCDALLNSDAVVDTELRALCVDLTRQQNDEVQLLEAWLLTQGHPSHASGHNHWCDPQPPPRCVAPTSLIVALVLFALFQALIVFTLVRSDRRKGSATKEADVPLR